MENVNNKKFDFKITINRGLILPIGHPNYYDGRIAMELADINNQNIIVGNEKYTIKTEVLLKKIKKIVDENFDKLINYSKLETQSYISNHFFDSNIEKNITINYGSLNIYLNGNVHGEIGSFFDELINSISQLIIDESNMDDYNYIYNNMHNQKSIGELNEIDVINSLVDRIEMLDNGTQFSFTELINIDGLNCNLRKITLNTLKELKNKGIIISSNSNGIVGLPENIIYIKVGKQGEIEESR